MRILFTFAGGRGHLEPLLPLARAARAAGHDVLFAGRPWMIPQVEAPGFRGGRARPPWLAELRDAPTVHFTLGTVFNHESGELFQRVLAGLRELLLAMEARAA